MLPIVNLNDTKLLAWFAIDTDQSFSIIGLDTFKGKQQGHVFTGRYVKYFAVVYKQKGVVC